MTPHFQHLYRLSRQRERRIIGLMSGTSLDGLDVALCRFRGSGLRTRVTVERFATRPYDAAFQAAVREVFAQQTIDFQKLVLLNVTVAERHAALVLDCLRDWGIRPDEVDVLASHGQTVYHAPRVLHGLPDQPNATLQIGDGDHLARRTGILTLSDFRQKHLAAGGEGAPLALYGDYFLFSKKGEARVLINIGGIANFTYLPPDGEPARAFATDTGPGNTLLDAYARQHFNVPCDEGARLAANGRVDAALLEALLTEPYFAKPFPKTTGPELFRSAWVEELSALPKGHRNPYDLMRTLTELTARSLAEAIGRIDVPDAVRRRAFLSGGGAHNPLLVSRLKALLPGWSLQPMALLGVDGDAKEAVLFAALANEALAGQYPEGAMLGGLPLVRMGKLSLPD